MFQVKAFGSLVKGLRIGLDLLTFLQKEGHGIFSLSTVLNFPLLNGSNGLDGLLTQFEAAVDNDFPHYQVCAINHLTISFSTCTKPVYLFKLHIG